MRAVDAQPALFRAHPALARALPHRSFIGAPTPVEPLRMRGLPEYGVFVKRDDRACALVGGNKPRKLEFLIGAALARGSRRLVTPGGLGTHHGLATAILGRAAKLETTLVLVDQPLTEEVVECLSLQAAYGAEQVYGRNVPGALLQMLRVLGRSTLAGERPTLVWIGGSSPLGNLGFVSAGFELADQIRAGELPEPAEVFVPVGSGGTMAGLALGLRLCGLRTRVVGVLATDILPPSPARLALMARRTLRLLRRHHPAIERVALDASSFRLIQDQIGPGYGAATPAAQAALEDAAEVGLSLDSTYSAKCMAALRVRGSRAAARGPVLFWNTHNGVDVGAAAPQTPEARLLPRRLRRLVDLGGREGPK